MAFRKRANSRDEYVQILKDTCADIASKADDIIGDTKFVYSLEIIISFAPDEIFSYEVRKKRYTEFPE